MTDEQLAEKEARANAATPGPWRAEFPAGNTVTHSGDQVFSVEREDGLKICAGTSRKDASFIARAREDVLALAAEVRRLRAVAEDAYELAVTAAPYMPDYYADRYRVNERLGKVKAAMDGTRG